MKTYLLSFCQPDGPVPPPEVLERVMSEIAVINEELRVTNSWVFAGGLHAPSTATVVRVNKDAVTMTDGPFAEGKEHIGGISVIRAPDLDVALTWARRFAQVTTLPIEVRPFQGDGD